jgi:hypothetical protein
MSEDRPKIFLGMPILREMHPIVFNSILQHAQPYVTNIHTEEGYSKTLDLKRNSCVRNFLGTDCTHLLFWDSDTVAVPNAIKILLEYDKPVVSAVVYRKGGQHLPCFGSWDEELEVYKTPIPFEYNKLQQVDIVGTGFVLIKREVFEQLEYPWFKCYERGNAQEDIFFCLKCREAGIPLYVDTGLHLGHIATPYLITNETYEMNLFWSLVKRFRDQGKLEPFKKALYKQMELEEGEPDVLSFADDKVSRTLSLVRSDIKPMNVNLLFVGIDGLDGLAIQNIRIPMLNKMGQYGNMLSIDPFHTGPCWTSIYTGVFPQQHGITSGGWTKGVSYAENIKVPTLWQKIPSIGVFNMPMTWRPYKVDGWMVSGFPAISNRKYDSYIMTHPEDIDGYLPDDYVHDITDIIDPHSVGDVGSPMGSIYDPIRKIAKSRITLCRQIYRDLPVRNIAIGYTFPDRFGHAGHYSYTWVLLEEILWDIFNAFDYRKLVIVSDHGFAGNTHTKHSTYLTNFGGHPEHLTDIHDMVLENI